MSSPPALPPTPMLAQLDARLRGPGSAARIDKPELDALAEQTGLHPIALASACLSWAQRWALAPVSSFPVGAAALAESGVLYLGANLEFCGLPLAHTVHAEQSAIAHAWSCGETTLRAIATSAAPCGYCRQFMLELPEPRPLLLLADQGPVELSELLPRAFGPSELGRTPQLLRAGPHGLELARSSTDPLAALALAAADRSSAPYSGGLAGVAVETVDGQRFAGAVAESAAYNPTLAPMQAALIAAHHGGARLDQIARAVLVELESRCAHASAAASSLSHFDAAAAVLACVAPRATLVRLTAVSAGQGMEDETDE